MNPIDAACQQFDKEEEEELLRQKQEEERLYFADQRRQIERLNATKLQTTDDSVDGKFETPSENLKANFFSSCCGSHLYSRENTDELEYQTKLANDHNTTSERQPVLSNEELNQKKLTAVLATKEDGNLLFKEKQYAQAIEVYERGTLIAMMVVNADPKMSKMLNELDNQLNLNIALCEIRRDNGYSALALIQRVIDRDPTLVKAWYRKAQALIDLQEFELALKAIEQGREAKSQAIQCPIIEARGENGEEDEFTPLEKLCKKRQQAFEVQAKRNMAGMAKRIQSSFSTSSKQDNF